MSVNDTPNLYDTLEALDETLWRLVGVIMALKLLSDDLGTSKSSAASSAFWALLAGAESFLKDGQSAANTIHKMTKGGAV